MNKDLIIEEDFQEYKLQAKSLKNNDGIKLRIIHKKGGGHFAEHTKVQILDTNSSIIGSENITKENIVIKTELEELETNKISLIFKDEQLKSFPLKSKTEVAIDILNEIIPFIHA